mmetsp:Transcript_13439/g.44267  ORF Transcript_13439/g.44267 Transcript_13439/m.44267 type:complete len:1465 (-) Transcript_13439:1441-5835(-)
MEVIDLCDSDEEVAMAPAPPARASGVKRSAPCEEGAASEPSSSKPPAAKRAAVTRDEAMEVDDDEDDGDVVVCEEAGEKSPAVGADAAAELSDGEDVAMLGETGTTVLRDLPHPRGDCLSFVFSKTVISGCANNALKCENCFCYVCDVVAKDCKSWGDGSSPTHHCHAHHASQYWRGERTKQRGGGGGASAGASAAGLLPNVPVFTPAIAPLSRQVTVTELPDPSLNPSFELFGSVRMPFKCVSSTYNIAYLQQRVVRFGFQGYAPRNNPVRPDGSVRLWLGDLCAKSVAMRKGQWLSFTRLAMPAGLLELQLPTTFIIYATVIRWNGADTQRKVALEVPFSTTYDELHEPLRKIVQPEIAESDTFVFSQNGHIAHMIFSFRKGTEKVIPSKKEFQRRHQSSYSILAFVVPSASVKPDLSGLLLAHTRGKFPHRYNQSDQYSTVTQFAVLLPESELSGITNGQTSRQEVTDLFAKAVSPMKKPNETQVMRGLVTVSYVSRTTRQRLGSFGDDAGNIPWSQMARNGDIGTGLKAIAFDFDSPQTPFDTSLSESQTDYSKCFPGVKERERELNHHISRYSDSKGEATRILQQLDEATRDYSHVHATHTPGIRLKLTVEADEGARQQARAGSKPKHERGFLKVEVFHYKSHARPPTATSIINHSFSEHCSIDRFVAAMCKQEPDGKRFFEMSRSHERVVSQTYSLNSLPDMLAWVEKESSLYGMMEQPDGLNVTLRDYQRQALKFMVDQERHSGACASRSLFFPFKDASGNQLFYSPMFKNVSTTTPPDVRGGILAEEMGLGKTIEALALILANPAEDDNNGASTGPSNAAGAGAGPSSSSAAGAAVADFQFRATHSGPSTLIESKATLVVCAVSLVGQWVSEVKSKLEAPLKIYEYHGSQRIRDPQRLAEYDVVVTTYQTLGRDFQQRETKGGVAGLKQGVADSLHPLGAISWHRVFLDEAHYIKSTNVGQAKACLDLHSLRRWACTGTPVSSSIDDLYGLAVFLKIAPFDTKAYFNTFLKTAFQHHRIANRSTLGNLLNLLKAVMMRHTKKQQIGGADLLKLPPKTEVNVKVTLVAKENKIYQDLETKAKAEYQLIRACGVAEVNRKIFQIMSMLLPLRRVCSGGSLTEKDLQAQKVGGPSGGGGGGGGGASSSTRSAAANQDVKPGKLNAGATTSTGAAASAAAEDAKPSSGEGTICSLCQEILDDPVKTSCDHWYCRACLCPPEADEGAKAKKLKCTVCNKVIKAGDLTAKADPSAAVVPAGKAAVVSESKLEHLLTELTRMRDEDETYKALVFSNFNSTMEWLKTRLVERGFSHRTITGSMPMKQRAKAIEAFQKDPPTTVFLLSVRSGAVGINLTSASHVFLLEPCLNAALEQQAIGRAWRMGQQRPVTVKRLYVPGTVEERIITINEKRTTVTQAKGTQPVVPPRGKGKQAMLGALQQDKQHLKANELEFLFGIRSTLED